ncbi:homeodomain family transcription factor STE12 PWA37_004575 [Arxiozyma heterogenica]|uniref:homeodomain family transcription factor STE12 n=1 Tax=Arxiozyma heterogenica TaxID=278026 RepID=UPI002EF03D50
MITQESENTKKNRDLDNKDPNDKTITSSSSQKADKNLIQTTYVRNDQEIQNALNQLDELYFFIRTAPVRWSSDQLMRRYYLTEELGFITCILWNNLFYITGTDIVKSCIYQMEQFGRQIVQRKKFEEGIFSDLRNLKCGKDAILEQPKSNFLSFLFKNVCLKTQKKQKIFFWFNVPHLQLFIDALCRDLKREESNQLATTKAISEPALSFKYNPNSNVPLMDQLISYLNNGKINGFTNMITDLEDDNGNNSDITTNDTTNNNYKKNRSNTNRFTKKERQTMLNSTKPNLSLPLNNSSINNHINSEKTYAVIDEKINTNNNNNNNIVTHTLILHDNSRLETYNNDDDVQNSVSNNFNEHFMKTNNNNNKYNIIPDRNTKKNNNKLLSPLNISFNNSIDNLNDQDFPLDYLPVIDDVLINNKQGTDNQTSMSLDKEIPYPNINKDQTSYDERNNSKNDDSTAIKEEDEDSDDDENVVVPVTVANFDKNNRYSKPYRLHNLLESIHQVANKGYYMINKVNSMSRDSKNRSSNEIEVTVFPYDIGSNKNISTDNIDINNSNNEASINKNPSSIENCKSEYPINESIPYNQHGDFSSHQTVPKTNLKINDSLLSIQENLSNLRDEYTLWGNSVLPFQSYNTSINQHLIFRQAPSYQEIYNNSITPVTKFNPYIGQSPWGSSYLSNSVFGINSPPGLNHTVSQPYQTQSTISLSGSSSSMDKNKISGKINIQPYIMKSMESPTHQIKRQKK